MSDPSRIKTYSSRKIFEVDILKALAITMLLAYHVCVKTSTFYTMPGIFSSLAELVGVIGLSLFFYMSGFTLFLNNKVSRMGDIILYLKKRVTRIYPLYWFFIIIFILTSHLTAQEIIIFLSGFQALLYPVYISTLTLHFITAILVFYLMYPIIAYFSRDSFKMTAIIVLFFALLLLLQRVLGFVDNMVIAYYGLFILGVVTGKFDLYNKLKQEKAIQTSLLVLSVLALFSTAMFVVTYSTTGSNTFLVALEIAAIVSSVAIFYLAVLYVKRFGLTLSKPVSMIAYSTYAVFLVNMPIFNVIENLSASHSLGILEFIPLMVLTVPFIFIVGYIIQWCENKILNKLSTVLKTLNNFRFWQPSQ